MELFSSVLSLLTSAVLDFSYNILTMGSTAASSFPRIKEVRTFLIDGVGSGGDYHNVSSIVQLNAIQELPLSTNSPCLG